MMKKVRTSLLALLMIAAVCVSLSGCGLLGKAGDTTAQIEAYLDAQKDELDKLREAGGDTMSIDIKAEGNSLVYIYQYKIDLGMDNETAAEQLDENLAEQDSVFSELLKELRKFAPGAESVVVEYQDKDGQTILKKTYDK